MRPSLLQILALASITGALAMSTPMKLRVVCYNVLSSHLASTTQFPTYNPDHLKASNRLPRILDKLETEIQASKNGNVVLCLQEVSYDWAGELHTFFAKRGFHLVTGLYGKSFNGYMGVCLAWPTDRFDVVDVDLSRVSDTREGGWPANEVPTVPTRLWSGLQRVLDKPLRSLGLVGDSDIDHWSMAERRFNVMVSAKLTDKDTRQTFAVSTYHMPCAFYAPKVMTIHSDLAARYVQRFADGSPYVFAGDFNIKPSDSMYRLLSTGDLDKNDPCYPTPKSGVEWRPTLESMESAYAVKDGREPGFTNYAQTRQNEPFVDTLDYIFLERGKWVVDNVLPARHRDESGGPFPNLDEGEPSDHVVIAADITLKV